MIWYRSRDDKCLTNLSDAVAFEIIRRGDLKISVEAFLPTGDMATAFYIETFDSSNAQAKAKAFIRWLATIIVNKQNDCVYDYADFSAATKNEVTT